MNREELKDKSVDEVQDLLQKELDEFKAKVSEIKDLDELNKLEEEVDKEQEELDKYLQEAVYPLNENGVEFEGKTYKMKDLGTKIVYYLNRIEQSFQYVLGLHALVRFWKQTDVKEIPYGTYDSTLRLLGQVKYKGDNEWTDILAINNFLSASHEPYRKDQSLMIMLAEKRNAVLDQIKLNSPVSCR